MGLSSSPGQAPLRKASHSVGFLFGTGLFAPVSCLLVLWALLTAGVLSGALDHRLRWLAPAAHGHRVLAEAAVVTGAGLVVVFVAVILMGRFAGRVRGDAENLVAIARSLADEGLPRVVEALRDEADGRAVAAAAANAQWPAASVSEIDAAAEAVASMYRAAVSAAAAEAGLRSGFRQILVSLGRRNQSLLHRQLRIIDALEQQAESPTALAELFTLDHLTTRMRRHAESLTILSGAAPARVWSQPVQVVDVMRAAAAEVEDYTRVTVISDAAEADAVAASAVTDLIHLLAELIENATLFSPSSTRVEVRAERVANGFAIEVEDRGLGIPPDQLAELNSQLANPPDFDRADADRLGLFVAGRLAARHRVHVSLGQSPYRGTKAVVMLPDDIVASTAGNYGTERRRPRHESGQLNLQAPEVLSMAGAIAGSTAPGGAGAAGTVDTPAQAGAQPRNVSTIRGLPRRVRSDSGSPGDSGSAARQEGPAPRRAPVDAPGPEDARSLAASLQNSWQRSRQPDNGPDDEEGLWL